MLIAKINPAAKFSHKDSPFGSPIEKIGDFIAVSANPYIAGATVTDFTVEYCTATIGEDGKASDVASVGRGTVQLTSEDLAAWGTDDTILLELAATKAGTTFVEAYEVAVPVKETI